MGCFKFGLGLADGTFASGMESDETRAQQLHPHDRQSGCEVRSGSGRRTFNPALERGSDLRMRLGYPRPPVIVDQ
jgi:hypothetical protein